MTMIELLVAMAIGVTVTLAVSTLLVASENQKRITTSSNDADQTLVYTFSELDRALRGAGSGIAQSQYSGSQGILGCRLNMASNGVTYMPRPGAYPAPFSNYFLGGASPTALHMAPVLIGANQSDNNSSDVIVVMGGSGSAGGVPRAVYGAGSGVNSNIQVVLENTVGFNPYDVVLVSQNGVTDCLIEEVNVVTPTTLTMNTTTTYYTPGTTTTLNTLASSTASLITPLGNEATTSAPNNVQFTMYGVGTNNTLYSYDLMQYASLAAFSLGGDTTQPIADQVIQMNALYGVNALYGNTSANPSQFSSWVSPSTAHYDIVSVMNSPTTQASIVAVRVAIVVRGEYYDKKAVSPTSLTIFSGLVDGYGNSLSKTVTLPSQNYRYRVYEFTVPLRDMIILAGGP
jgi:type IV pilus assembly protein PilW